MRQYFFNQLPDFARPSHPVMRHQLNVLARRITRRGRLIRFMLALLSLIVLVAFGVQITIITGASLPETTGILDRVFMALFWPLVLGQLMVRMFALGSTSGIIANEVQLGTWDTLKVTTHGVAVMMKTHWARVFYRARFVLLVLVAARVFFIIVSLVNLTDYQGRRIDLLLSGTTPFGLREVPKDTSILIGIVVLAVMMTASLLAPFTSLALDSALGIFIGTLSAGRIMGLIGQVFLIGSRVIVTLVALQAATMALSFTRPEPWFVNNPTLAWVAALLGIAEGDVGLSMLFLPYVQRLWADREYGILVGVAFLVYTLLQAALANLLVRWAARRAAKADRI